MTAAPRTCSTFSTVLEAVMIFRDSDCGAVPILEEGKPVAVLTDRDVALALSEFPDLAGQSRRLDHDPGRRLGRAGGPARRGLRRASRSRECGACWSSIRKGECGESSAGPTSRRCSRTG